MGNQSGKISCPVLFVSFYLCLAGCSDVQDQQTSEEIRIFRKVTLAHNQSFILGENISTVKSLCERNSEGYSLEPGAFGLADSMVLYTDDDDVIFATHTYYDEGISLSEKAEDYRVNFFHVKPSGMHLPPVNLEYWENDSTVFAILELQKNILFTSLCDKTKFGEYISGMPKNIQGAQISKDLHASINMMKSILKQ